VSNADALVTIIIPVYNEAENIRAAIERINAVVAMPYLISVVYDTDEDTTVPVARDLSNTHKNIKLLKNKYGRGALNAIKSGLEESNTKYTVVTMADLSDPPEVINDMFDITEKENAAIVCASRYMKGGKQVGGPFLKGLLSRCAGVSLYWLAGLPVHDATNSFKLYRTSFLRTQKIESAGGFELGIELVVKAYIQGEKIAETPTTWTDRAAGKSNFKLFAWLLNYLKWYFYAFKKKEAAVEKPIAEAPKAKPPATEPPVKNIFEILFSYRAFFVKYFFVGAFCAIINWAIFYLLNYKAGLYYLAAGFAAFIVSCTVNYFLSRNIFASRGRKKYAEYLFLLIVSAIALCIDLFVMYLLVEYAKLPAILAKVLSTASAFLFNYAARQFFIFSSKV